MGKKFGSQRGETIVETLAAILIAALSCTILMTSVTAAVSINKKAAEAQQKFETELLEAEMQMGTLEGGVTVSIKENTGHSSMATSSLYTVLFTGGEGKLTSYKYAEEEHH